MNLGPEIMSKTWLPLEANPELLTSYSRKLGLPEQFEFHDVLAVEEWALEMIPHPVQTILLLYPLGDESAAMSDPGTALASEPIFMKQKVENACGTIAVLHAMLNLHAQGRLPLSETSFVKRMFDATKSLSADDRGDWLESDPEIESAHASFESGGQSAVTTDDVDTHFIAFVPSADGKRVIELDGRKTGPIDHGEIDYANPTDPFGVAVLNVIKSQFIDKNPEDIRFSILALS